MYLFLFSLKINLRFYRLTLKGPKFLTEHASLTFLPAGTVIFSMISVNSGPSCTAENKEK